MKEIFSKLVGVTFHNRQDNLQLVNVGFNLFWKCEEDNPFDKNAIIVYADPEMKIELGHIKKELAAELQGYIGAKREIKIIAEQLTGTLPKQTFGLNVKILIEE